MDEIHHMKDGINSENPYPTTPRLVKGELQDLFVMPDGSRLARRKDWSRRAEAWRDLVLDIEYGGMPPAPERIEVEDLCHAGNPWWKDEPRLLSYRITCHGGDKPLAFCVKVIFPANRKGPFPAVIHGDGCWWNITDAVGQLVMENNCALVLFNRTEIVADLGYGEIWNRRDVAEAMGYGDSPDKTRRVGGLYELYPDHTFGAIAAWAWGFHRCVDLIESLPFIDASRIAVTGHSRGGKTALVAGVTDERIGIVNDAASCAGGSSAYRYVGHGGETLEIVDAYPTWFGPKIQDYLGREEDLPFDQHCLLAAIAPRPLLMTYALDDRWSNPEGMVQAFWAGREVYRFVGFPDRIAFNLRLGEHLHSLEDWRVLMDFANWHWHGLAPMHSYNEHPYTHLVPAFSWKAPEIA